MFLTSFKMFFRIPFMTNVTNQGSAGKESTCNVRDPGSIPGLGRSPREGKGYPLQYSGLENSMDCIVHRVTKSWTQLWKILQEMGIPDHLTCLLRNLYAGQKQQLELDMKKQTGFKLGKEYIKAVYCHIQNTSREK